MYHPFCGSHLAYLRDAVREELHHDRRVVVLRFWVHVVFQICLSFQHRGVVRVVLRCGDLRSLGPRFLGLHCAALHCVRQRLRVELKILLVVRYDLLSVVSLSVVLLNVMSRVLRRLSAMLRE